MKDCLEMLKFKKFEVGKFCVCKEQICYSALNLFSTLCISGSTDARHVMLWKSQAFCMLRKLIMI